MGDKGAFELALSGRMILETAAHRSKAKQAVMMMRFVTQKKVNSSIGSCGTTSIPREVWACRSDGKSVSSQIFSSKTQSRNSH